MGRRKQKQLSFVQGNSLAEELEGTCSDEDEPGGLHIGGIVIRAPARSRAAEHPSRPPRGASAAAPSSSSNRAVHTRTQPQQVQQREIEQAFNSDDSLDEELRDYLDNVKQHDEDSGEDAEQDRAGAAAAAPARLSSRKSTAGAAVGGSSSSEEWEELGSRPGLGFAGLSAAARFAAVSLDDALEGNLGRDMQQCNSSSSNDDSSSSSSGDLSGSDSDDSGSDEDEAEEVDFASLDASTAVVVDAQGRPMAVWESLSLQQRFPVQTRAGLSDAAGELGLRQASSRSKRQQHGRRIPSGTSSGRAGSAGVVLGIAPLDMPAYECEATAAAVQAAYAAALAAADVESVQRQQHRQQQKSLAKGAQRGQLLPGEKKQLRKEKIAAKRCARRGERGQGALALLAAVERFALGGGDVEVLPPCGKHKQAFVRSVAKLYGVRAAAQGGSSSGRTCLVLASTPDTAPPAAAAAAARLQALLTAELTREVTAAAIAAVTDQQHAASAAGAAGQQAGSSRQRERRSLQQQGSRGAAGDFAVSAFQQPVAFVRGGTLDPNHSSSSNSTAGQQAGGSTLLPPAAAAAVSTGSYEMEPAAAAAAAGVVEEGEAMPQVPGAVTHAAAGSSSARATAAAAADVGEFLESLLLDVDGQAPASAVSQQQQQQQQQQEDGPAWVIDRNPCCLAGPTGLGFAGQAASAPAAADIVAGPAAEVGCTVESSSSAAGVPARLYDRAPVRFGLGFSGGSASVQQQQQQEDMQQEATTSGVAGTSTAAAAAGPSSSRQDSQQLQALEDKFATLWAAPNSAAAKRQQRRERHQHKKLEARLSAPNTALGPVVAAAAVSRTSLRAVAAAAGDGNASGDDESAELVVTLGMTAQQVQKAKKQQLRNQRRESRQAAAPAGDGPDHDAAAAAVGNVHGSFAGFEAHTRGIGSRLMAGWGWREGEGLGRARQGRPEPLQAVRRERQLGLGAA